MTPAQLQGLMLGGMAIRPSTLAVKTVTYWEVRKHPTQKRRRGWAALKLHSEEPAVFVMAGQAFVHPSIYEQIKRDLGASKPIAASACW